MAWLFTIVLPVESDADDFAGADNVLSEGSKDIEHHDIYIG